MRLAPFIPCWHYGLLISSDRWFQQITLVTPAAPRETQLDRRALQRAGEDNHPRKHLEPWQRNHLVELFLFEWERRGSGLGPWFLCLAAGLVELKALQQQPKQKLWLSLIYEGPWWPTSFD